MISSCFLLYGDYPALASRCLGSFIGSIVSATGELKQPVADMRIGLNNVSQATAYVVDKLLAPIADKLPVWKYVTERNVYKYPLMRRMFHDSDRPLAEYAMWFDDDSYVTGPRFWPSLLARMPLTMAGQPWFMPLTQRRWRWITTLPWANPEVQYKDKIEFCQGGWWVLSSAIIRQLNWPIPELRHCGGDTLLGEALRHLNLPRCRHDIDVAINADDLGRHSKATRRGHSESNLGDDYNGKPYATAHHDFDCQIVRL